MNSSRPKTVAYIRISSTRQIDNESPETQRESIRKYAESNGLEIVKWFEDIAKSGKNTEREGLQELLKYCLSQKGEIQHWIVYNMKRASRDIDTYSTNVRTVLKSIGVTVRSATEPAVTDTKEGRFMENLLVMLGQLDNEGKAEVTVDNMKSLALQGYWQHPPVVGYEITKKPNELGKPRPTLKKSSMSDKVQKVLERFSKGDITKAELTRYAKAIGLKSRYDKFLSEDSIHRLLKNPVYAGYVADKFTEYKPVEGKHEGIISKYVYETNQKLIHANNSRKGERHDHLNPEYPLRDLLLCMNCNKKLYSSAPRTGNGDRSPRYHCSRKSCTGKVPSVKAETVHEEFVEMLERIKPSSEILRTYRHVLVKEANHALDNLNKRIANRRDSLDKISKQRSGAISKFVDGSLTKEEKDEFVRNSEAQKIQISQELEQLERQQMIRESDIDTAINVMESVHEQWSNSELDLQHRFQRMLFPRGLVYDSKEHRFGTSEISELYRCISMKKGSKEPLNSYLVAQVSSVRNNILEELARWKRLSRVITDISYSTH